MATKKFTYEVKSTRLGGSPYSDADGNFSQQIFITIGIKDCPYNEIYATREAIYEFPGTSTIVEISEGISKFAEKWVSENYPNT